MTVRYASQNMEWTESMKNQVGAKLVKPLARLLRSRSFELSVHVDRPRAQSIHGSAVEMWAVLQTFDGKNNRIFRRHGRDLARALDELYECFEIEIAKSPLSRKLLPIFLRPSRHLTKVPFAVEAGS